MDISSFLSSVSKPTRYLGHELNAVYKEWEQVKYHMALSYPDLYEVGMSNLALKILYGILNQRSDTLAERVFNPWPDAEQKMKEAGILLYSLESKKPLREFEAIGFTLPYELCYTNILNILNLAHIPFLSSERDESYPLLIGGGPGAFNPEPIADFFDLFVLGDGEEVIHELVEGGIKAKEEKWSKGELLEKMATLQGVYVPSHFHVSYYIDGTIQEIKQNEELRVKNEELNIDGTIREIKPSGEQAKIEKRTICNLNQVFYPSNPVISYTETVHDRYSLEIARGCTRGCRFCQAGYIYRPVRERSLETLQSLARESIKATGYEEISLLSLSSSDYSQLEALLSLFQKDCRNNMTALSLPSLRPGTLTSLIISYIKEVRKTGFTIAPEAGTQRLRNVINKGITEEDILATVQQIFEQGWDLLKLYFMIGLPTEQIEDIDAIASLCKKIFTLGRKTKKGNININVTISPFVPKPHTPFQRMPQESIKGLEEKEKIILKNLRNKVFKIKCRNPQVSCLEAALARGDRRLSRVLIRAWELGSRFDQWSEHFDFDLWQRAFADSHLDLNFYAHRDRGEHEILPWHHLSSGVSDYFFTTESKKAFQEIATPDCRVGHCHTCSACKDKEIALPPLPDLIIQTRQNTLEHDPLEILKKGETKRETSGDKACQLRVKFQKTGPSIYMSHLDLTRVFSRAIRRAGLPISFSQGFHPHPKMTFALPLPVGVEGLGEYADFIFRESINPEEFMKRMNEQLPKGIKLLETKNIPLAAKSISPLINHAIYQISISDNDQNQWLKQIDHKKQLNHFLAKDECWIQKKKKDSAGKPKNSGTARQINLRSLVKDITLTESPVEELGFIMTLVVGNESVNPKEVLEALYERMIDFPSASPKIIRQGLYIFSHDRFWDPLDLI